MCRYTLGEIYHMIGLLFIVSYLLSSNTTLLFGQLTCPSARRIKPCQCETINKSTGLVEVYCLDLRSWTLVKQALRPFRRRRLWQLWTLHIENIGQRRDSRRGLRYAFRHLLIGQLVIRRTPLQSILSSNVFKDTKIFSITLDKCGLSNLNGRLLDQNSVLQEIILPNNMISGHVEEFDNWGKADIRKVDLSRNELKCIRKRMFEVWPNLEALYLRGNDISSIEEGAFLKAASLKILDLTGNFITVLDPDTFIGLRRLDFLSIAYNPADDFQSIGIAIRSLLSFGQNSLRSVDVSGTSVSLTHLLNGNLNTLVLQQWNSNESDICCLSRNPYLTQLDLTGNSHLSVSTFRKCPSVFASVVDLDIGRTNLQMSVTRYFPTIRRLFAYRSTKIRRLGPYVLRKNRRLETLEVVYGRLRSIERHAFRGIEHSLAYLSLAYNRLRHLQSDVLSSLEHLTSLDMSFNSFRDYPLNHTYPLNRPLIVRSAAVLKQLNLAGNKLVRIPILFTAKLSNLRLLNLAGNDIRRLYHNDFSNNINLVELNLEGNSIEYVDPEAFSLLKKLKHLNLAANHLRELSPSVELFPERLETLDLSYNELSSLDYVQLSYLSRLRSVDLSHNQIRTIKNHTFAQSARSLVFINLDDNELDCSCSFRPFVEWLSASRVTLSANSRCYFPHALKGLALIEQVCWSRCHDQHRQSIEFCT